MPTYDIESPDGKKYSVEVPDGVSGEDVVAHFAQGQPAQEQPPMDWDLKGAAARTGRIAAGGLGAIADIPVMVGQAGYDATRGIQQLTGANVAPAYKMPLPSEGAVRAYDALTGGAGVPQNDMQKIVQAGGQLLASGGAAGLAAKAPQVAGQTANALKMMAAPSTKAGAASMVGAGAGGEIARQEFPDSAIAPVVGSLVGGIAPAMRGALARSALPNVNKETAVLAAKAREFGIPLRADQVSGGRVGKTIQKIGQELPFSGADTFENTQKIAFNKALASTIGQEADNLNPETIIKFQSDASRKFSDVLKGQMIKTTPEDMNGIMNIKKEARSVLSRDLLGIVDNNVNSVIKDIKSGVLSGEKLSSIRSVMLKNAARAEGSSKGFVGDIIEQLDNIASKNISPEKVQQLTQARREWRNFRTIEPLLEKSVDGNINPTELLSKVSGSKYIKASRSTLGQDDLVDLARIGKQFLPKLGGSDTFQKTIIGGVGGLGATAVLNPALALQGAAITGVTLAANRGVQALGRNQKIIDAAIKKGMIPKEIGKLPPAVALEAIKRLQEQNR